MRRYLVEVIVTATLLLAGASRVDAQDATPTAIASADPSAPLVAEDPFLSQVDHRFAAFAYPLTQPNEVAALEDLLVKIPQDQGADRLHDRVRDFLRDHQNEISGAPWSEMSGHYRAKYIYPASYSAQVWLRAPGTPGTLCSWTSPGVVVQPAVAPCSNPVHLVLPRGSDNAGSKRITLTVVQQGAPAGAVLASGPFQIRDRLIVSLGDSFASGEGNPDVPAKLNLGDGPGSGWQEGFYARWPGLISPTLIQGRRWLDGRCHRSYLNQHLIAALEYSAYHPEEAVTFVSYACSGATIFSGVLALQQSPPGAEEYDSQVKQSQLQSLLEDLCAIPGVGAASVNHTIWKEIGNDGKTVSHAADQATCASSAPRPVDAFLVSIGGNDIGFGGIIQDALLPHPSIWNVTDYAVVKAARKYATTSPQEAARRIKQFLPTNLATLSVALRSVAPLAIIVQSGYPSPLRAGDQRRLCGPPDKDKLTGQGDPSFSRLAALEGVWPTRVRGLTLTIDQKASAEAERLVVLPLNQTLETAAKANHWRFINGYRDQFLKHGWCAGDGAVEAADLPLWKESVWGPFDPSTWDAYSHRARYFRTPNDAFLTQMPDHAGRLLESKEGFGRVLYPILMVARVNPTDQESALLSAFSGAFHPTFEAHVLMGQSVATELGLAQTELPQVR